MVQASLCVCVEEGSTPARPAATTHVHVRVAAAPAPLLPLLLLLVLGQGAILLTPHKHTSPQHTRHNSLAGFSTAGYAEEKPCHAFPPQKQPLHTGGVHLTASQLG